MGKGKAEAGVVCHRVLCFAILNITPSMKRRVQIAGQATKFRVCPTPVSVPFPTNPMDKIVNAPNHTNLIIPNTSPGAGKEKRSARNVIMNTPISINDEITGQITRHQNS
jgi:hypothetical protein